MSSMYKTHYSLLILVILYLIPNLLLCEQLTRNAELKKDLSGKTVALLYSGLEIDSEYPSSEYVHIEILIILKQDNFLDVERIRNGTTLIDTNGNIIGKSLSDLDVLVIDEVSPTKYVAMLSGYIPREAIDPSSIAERDLDKLVQNATGNISMEALFPQISKYKYRKWTSHEGFTSYIKFGSDLIGSPSHRALLVFYDQKLFALIHPNTVVKSTYFPFKNDFVVIQYFTNDKTLIKKFEDGFFFQYKSAG